MISPSNRASIRNISDYSPFGVQLAERTISGDGYRFGFQGQESDSEIKGEGNSVNYKYRMHDPRIGRFFAVDPLASKFPHNSPYAFSENRVLDAIELEGAEAKLIITDEIVGYTPQYVYGDYEDDIDNNAAIVVPVYRAILKDANTDKVMGTFGVTRDGWYSRGIVDDGYIYDDIELSNRAFEPADGNKNLYTGAPLNYPNESLPAYALNQYGSGTVKAEPFTEKMNTREDGTPIDDARANLGQAKGVMVHIGGWYNTGSQDKLAGSYGCFGFIPNNQIYAKESHAWSMIENSAIGKHGTSNESYMDFINTIINTINNTGGEKKLLISVEKRENVEQHQTLEDQ